MNKIFETNSGFHVKYNTLLGFIKFSFWEEYWAVGYNSMKF